MDAFEPSEIIMKRRKNTARRKAARKHKVAKALRRVGEGLKKKKNRRLGYS